MKLIYNGSKERQTYDKIGAIKCVRNQTGLGLKEAKEAVEAAVEEGSVEIVAAKYLATVNLIVFNQEMRAFGGFSVTSTLTELTDMIEKAIELAVNVREYKTARALINTLPREMRATHIGDID